MQDKGVSFVYLPAPESFSHLFKKYGTLSVHFPLSAAPCSVTLPAMNSGSSSVASSAFRRVGFLRIRAENTFLVNEVVLDVNGHGVGRLALLDPGDESVPNGRGLSAVAAGAVRQTRDLEQTVKVLGIGVPPQHLVVVVLRLFEGDDLVGLQKTR